MEHIQQEISYLRGFLAGNSSIEEKHHQVYDRLLSVMEELTEEYRQTHLRLTELEDYVEAIDEDLTDVEQIIFAEEDEELIPMTCPVCEEEVLIDQEDIQDRSIQYLCPNCQAVLIDREPSETGKKEKKEYEMQGTV